MSKIIPVMVHHETGEKAQAAGKKNQEYLKYCIAQAKKYNEKVVSKGENFSTGFSIFIHFSREFSNGFCNRNAQIFDNFSKSRKKYSWFLFKEGLLIR